MAKSGLGEKQLCPACGAKFYDLNKRPAVCPKCHTSFTPEETIPDVVRMKAKAEAVKPDDDPEEDDDEVGSTDEADDDEDAEEEATALELGDEADPALMASDTGEDDDDGAGVPAGFSEDAVGDDADDTEDEDTLLLDDDDEFDLDDDTDVDLDDEADIDGETNN